MRNKTPAIISVTLFSIVISLISSCSPQKIAKDQAEVTVVYPPPPETTRIQFLLSITSSQSINRQQTKLNRFLFGEAEPISIVKPYGITTQGSKIYICDTGIGGLVVIDLKERIFRQFIPEGKGKLQLPLKCAVDSYENIYIADGNRRQIVVFDKDGSYIDAFGESDESYKPTGVEVTDQNIFVSSISDHRIYVYNKSDYSLIRTLPEAAPEDPAYLYQPSAVACSEGAIYITDVGDCKVKVFGEDNLFIRSIGGYGNGFGQLMRPKGLAIDNELNTYIVDAAFENVQIFNPEGKLLMFFGGPYKSRGDMWLPADVAIDYENIEFFSQYVDPEFTLQYLIFVTNQFGPDKIGVYGFVKPK